MAARSRTLARRSVNDERFDEEVISEVRFRWAESRAPDAPADRGIDAIDPELLRGEKKSRGFSRMSKAQWSGLQPMERG